jgi:hypothetical protein
VRVLVCGSRDWINKEAIRRELSFCGKDPVIIEGEAAGADKLAREVAEEMGWEFESYPADWEHYGKAAGPIRNRRMLVEGKPDIVLAFSTHIKTSKGTLNMIQQAEAAHLCVEVYAE